MWQTIRKQITAIRVLINEYSILRTTNTCSNNAKVLKSISTNSNNQIQENHSQSNCLQLIAAHSGFSKEHIFNESYIKINSKYINGDDSWFMTNQKCADVLGIADGVGGWREMGIDPSIFSSNLMKQCKRIVEQENIMFSSSGKITENTPLDILKQSYHSLLENKNPNLIGSSTACIIVFNRESKYLHSANLGDSGFVVIRNNKIVHRSQEQYHYFNAPFQLALLPNLSGEDSLFSDKPQAASVSSFELAEGDFIVLATDGLWDNLNEGLLLLKISNINSYSLEDLEKAAKNIASFAVELSKDPDYMSPFALSARKHGINFRGGKPDDITVLLARVTKSK